MARTAAAVEPRPIIERWCLVLSNATCYGCMQLAGRVFRLGLGVLTPLHPDCTYRGLVIPTGTISAAAFAALVAEADHNGERAAVIQARAYTLMRRG